MASLKSKFAQMGEGKSGEQFHFLKQDKPQLLDLPIESIERDPEQPRKEVGDIEDLKASIREHGIIQPVTVSLLPGEERYRLIAGERRFTAAKEIGLETISCIVRSIEEHHRLEVQLIENIHRKDLSPVEEALTYRRLMDDFGLSQRQLSERLGRSLAGINQTLRILSLPEPILEGVQTSEHVTKSVLLEIAKLETEAEQMAFYEQARLGNLTVKAARLSKEKLAKPNKAVAPRSKVPILTKTASVTLVFMKSEVSPQEVVEALTEALRIARKDAKDSGASLSEYDSPEDPLKN